MIEDRHSELTSDLEELLSSPLLHEKLYEQYLTIYTGLQEDFRNAYESDNDDALYDAYDSLKQLKDELESTIHDIQSSLIQSGCILDAGRLTLHPSKGIAIKISNDNQVSFTVQSCAFRDCL